MFRCVILFLLSFIQKTVWPYSLVSKLQYKKDILRSFWLSSLFNKCPHSVIFGKVGRLEGMQFIQLGEKTSFQDYIYLTAWPRYFNQRYSPFISIGSDCNFGAYNHITCINRIVIGNGCLTGKWVTISDNNHGDISLKSLKEPPSKRLLVSKGPVVIGNNVWIGEKSTILANVTIGDGVIIGANSVVTKNIPDYSIAAGIPAKVICRKVPDNK